MDLISLIVILVVVGVILWLVNTYVPMDAKIKRILNIAVVIFVLLWLVVSFLGVTGNSVGNLRIE
jgi:1-acyl-sn-glycerol-3-phosphate acyltransferase